MHTQPQTHYEVVVVDADEQRCKNVAYERAAGPLARTAVHVSGRQFTKKGSGILGKNYFRDR